MTVADWIGLVALAIGIIGGGFTAWNSLRNEIRDSRHKVVADLNRRFDKMGEELDDHGERLNAVERDVAVLKASRGSG